jgi:transposase
MRGLDERADSLFSYVDLQDRVSAKLPLRVIRRTVNDVWLSEIAKIYADSGRPSIPPERLLRALLLQAFYNVAAPGKPLAWCSGKKVP